MNHLRSAVIAVAVVAASTVAATPSRAQGLFDFLFGGFSAPAPRYDYNPRPPLDVQVNPRRRRGEGNGAAVPVHSTGAKPLLQKAINVATTPNWHLADPTLRRGDIVVLKSGVYVFDGSRHNTTNQDFTALGQSNLVSKVERDRIESMAQIKGTRAHPVDEKESAPKQASLGAVTQ